MDVDRGRELGRIRGGSTGRGLGDGRGKDGKKFPEMKIAEKKRGVAARVAGKTAKTYCTLTSTTTTKTTDTKRKEDRTFAIRTLVYGKSV